VYDLTQWIDKHPGGAVVINALCGQDGTAGFTSEHGGKEKPEQQLASYLIGNLNNG
jgi:cytochrome b involved in lipid metabolism